jgi:hypothetical protein
MNIKHAAFLLVGIFVAQTTQASITLQMQVGPLRNSLGNIIPNNTTLVLVSDTNGFSNINDLGLELNGVNLSAGTTFGSGSRILQVIGASDLNSNDFGYSTTLSNLDLAANGLTGAAGTAGTDLALLWFPGLTGSAPQNLAMGQSFGFYRSDTVDAASYGGSAPVDAISFNVPTDGFTYQLAAYDTNLGGTIATSNFNATGVVAGVPEPSRSMLALIGVACLIGRRKRN